jgi:translocation and assembly module TamB
MSAAPPHLPSNHSPEPGHGQPGQSRLRRSRWRSMVRVLSWAIAVLLLLVALLVGWLFYAVQSERGSQQLWATLSWALRGAVTGEVVGGTLRHGMSLRNVIYANRDGLRIAIDEVQGQWRIGYSPRRVHISTLRAGTVDVTLPPADPAPKPSSGLPASITLPAIVDIDALAVERIVIRQGASAAASVTELSALRGALHSDGVRHRVAIDRLVTPYGRATLHGQLAGIAPFTLDATASLQSDFQGEQYQIAARATGSLSKLIIEADASGDRLKGRAEVEATPFDAVPLVRAQLSADHINPRVFSPGAPQADLSLRADVRPVDAAGQPASATDGQLTVAGPVSVRNALAGSLDQGRLPLQSVQAQIEMNQQRQKVSDLLIQLAGSGRISGHGEVEAGRGGFDLDVRALDPRALHGTLRSARLAGPLAIRLQPGEQSVALDLRDRALRLFVNAKADPQQITLDSARLDVAAGKIVLDGSLGRQDTQPFVVKGQIQNFDPAVVTTAAAGRINGTLAARGTLAEVMEAVLTLGVRDSEYAGLPLVADGRLHVKGQRLLPSELVLDVAGNRAEARGSFGAAGDRLRIAVNAPQLTRLQLGLAGTLTADADLSGTLAKPQVLAHYAAEGLVIGPHRLASANGKAELRDGLSGRVQFALQARGYLGPHMAFRTIDANVDGTQARHTFDVQANGALRGRPLTVSTRGQGGITQRSGTGWSGTVEALDAKGALSLALKAPTTLSVAPNQLVLGRTALAFDQSDILVESLAYQAGQFRSAGNVQALRMARVLELVQMFTGQPPPVRTDLVLDGDWNLTLAERAAGFAEIRRRSGDLSINTGKTFVNLGLSTLQLRAEARGDRLGIVGEMVSSRVGTLKADGFAGLISEGSNVTFGPNSPLGGKVALNVPDLERVALLMGPQMALKGRMDAALTAAGTLGQPKLSGAVNGDGLAVTVYDQGIRLQDGVVRIVLDQNVVDLRQVEFRGGEGTLKANGRVQLDQANPNLAATIVADKLQLFADPERTLIVSGDAKIENRNEQIVIDGKFTVDRGLFDLPKETAPELGDDVVIVRRDARGARRGDTPANEQSVERPAGRFAPVINLTVDMGRDFRFKGAGADLLLRGQLNVRSAPLTPMRGTGTIRIVDGTYEAFGRKLEIDRGVLTFQGPLNNPNLSIRAMRRNQEVEAGVEVTGTVRQPRVRLVSEPNVADEEKLSWLMFGYGTESAGTGQRQALAGAALGVIGSAAGKNLVQRFGLDEFSIGSSSMGLADQQVVSLGKSISEKISVGYEQSLSSAASVVKLTWQISRRWSAVARAGTINGLTLLYNRRFDSLLSSEAEARNRRYLNADDSDPRAAAGK